MGAIDLNPPATFADDRYYFPWLPPSNSPLEVNSHVVLQPSGYIIYIEPAAGLTVEEVQAAFGPNDALVPPEFYGGAIPFPAGPATVH